MAEEYLFPPALYCISCGAIIDGSREYMLCDDCMKEFKWNTGATCEICGKSLGPAISSAVIAGLFSAKAEMFVGGNAGNSENSIGASSRTPDIVRYCHNCMHSRHYFDKGYSCVSYGGREKLPILALKHGEKAYIARAFGQMLADRLLAAVAVGVSESGRAADFPLPKNQTSDSVKKQHFGIHSPSGEIPWELLIPVPIHPSRRVARGYNQTELIADEVSRLLRIPVDKTSLIRVHATEKMKGMTEETRQKNIEGAFAISADAEKSEILRNKNILLIDDVYTTGATADACSKALLGAGAKSVEIATIAAGSNFHNNDR